MKIKEGIACWLKNHSFQWFEIIFPKKWKKVLFLGDVFARREGRWLKSVGESELGPWVSGLEDLHMEEVWFTKLASRKNQKSGARWRFSGEIWGVMRCVPRGLKIQAFKSI